MTADGSYDTEAVYESVEEHTWEQRTTVVIPHHDGLLGCLMNGAL
jgi:hypothetical protein